MVFQNRTLMRPREHHERPVLYGHIVYQNTHREHIVIGVWVEGEILMPFDGCTVPRGFHVKFRRMQSQIRTKQVAAAVSGHSVIVKKVSLRP